MRKEHLFSRTSLTSQKPKWKLGTTTPLEGVIFQETEAKIQEIPRIQRSKIPRPKK